MTTTSTPDSLEDDAERGLEANPPRRRRLGFGVLLGVIVLIGIVIRAVYIVRFAPSQHIFPDSFWYYAQAKNLRAGDGYIDIARQLGAFNGHADIAGKRPTAYWPPLFPMLLAAWQTVVGDSIRESQLLGCLTGAATVGLTGLLGRAVVSRAVGLVAAGLVAISPFIIAVDGSLMSETLYLPLVILALLFAARARERPTAWSWILLGATIGLASLARGDALFLIPVVMIPAAILTRDSWRQVLSRIALGLLALAIVVAPWVVRNAIKVDDPSLSTISASAVLAVANCHATYYGRQLGSWSYPCMQPKLGYQMSETAYADKMQRKGINYAMAHVSRWPVVGAARVARVWSFWDPRDLTKREAVETRNRTWQWLVWPASLVTFWLGLAGFWMVRRQRRPIAVLVGPVVMVTSVALLTYGNTRFRAAAEPALLIGVAVVLVAAARRLHRPSPVT